MSDHPADWYPDPSGKHEHRYWDGTRWTDNVASHGRQSVDPLTGGAPSHPGWFHNLVADSNVQIQDGPAPSDYTVRLVTGDERAEWYARGEAVYPPYIEYAEKATEAGRTIPVFIATPKG